ncbi:acetate/propionate family kinase, partial [Vibrio cholerae O1]|nr:acetate/propionate family kinase [Vibrio cholerae O1]
RIGLKDSISTTKFDEQVHKREQDIVDHRQAVLLLMDELIHFKLISSFREITAIGHRVVAGGEFFKTST